MVTKDIILYSILGAAIVLFIINIIQGWNKKYILPAVVRSIIWIVVLVIYTYLLISGLGKSSWTFIAACICMIIASLANIVPFMIKYLKEKRTKGA